jgi:hypothetical protein
MSAKYPLLRRDLGAKPEGAAKGIESQHHANATVTGFF